MKKARVPMNIFKRQEKGKRSGENRKEKKEKEGNGRN
jgi:hypothetical protein